MCWVSERHNRLLRDERGRLHSGSGAALSYPDGWSIWAWHGVRVSQKVIEHPEALSVTEIESEKNAEVRRVMIERFGQAKYLLSSGAKAVHQDDFGTLYRKQIEGDEPLVMVKVVNATPEPTGEFKDYFLRVPPDVQTARHAVAWTFGKAESEYEPAKET
jgi:hypothetical protein